VEVRNVTDAIPIPPGWRERAHERSLATARRRVDDQLARLVRATQAIWDAGQDLTVPALVARAGMSTKTFYRYFSSRDDLLFAVVEEEFQAGGRLLQKALADSPDPRERLRLFVLTYLRLGQGYPTPGARRIRIEETQRLRGVDPARSLEALAPLHDALRSVLEDAAGAGLASGTDLELTTRSVLHLLNGHLVDLAFMESDEVRRRLEHHAVRAAFGVVGMEPQGV
jgi:AcrR family transcriptional regulator